MKRSLIMCIVGLLFISTNLFAAHGDLIVNGNLTVGGTVNGIRTKIIDIGDWDMIGVGIKDIAHGLDVRQIIGVSVMIRDDHDSHHYLFTTETNSASAWGRVDYIDSTAVRLARLSIADGGLRFDNDQFNATNYNRGWVTILYTVFDCDDYNRCTTDTRDPNSGECVNTVRTCNDNKLCTTDSCDVSTGDCLNTPRCGMLTCIMETGECVP